MVLGTVSVGVIKFLTNVFQENLTHLKTEFQNDLLNCDLQEKMKKEVHALRDAEAVLSMFTVGSLEVTSYSLLQDCLSQIGHNLICLYFAIKAPLSRMETAVSGIVEIFYDLNTLVFDADTIVWSCIESNYLTSWIDGNVTETIKCSQKFN